MSSEPFLIYQSPSMSSSPSLTSSRSSTPSMSSNDESTPNSYSLDDNSSREKCRNFSNTIYDKFCNAFHNYDFEFMQNNKEKILHEFTNPDSYYIRSRCSPECDCIIEESIYKKLIHADHRDKGIMEFMINSGIIDIRSTIIYNNTPTLFVVSVLNYAILDSIENVNYVGMLIRKTNPGDLKSYVDAYNQTFMKCFLHTITTFEIQETAEYKILFDYLISIGCTSISTGNESFAKFALERQNCYAFDYAMRETTENCHETLYNTLKTIIEDAKNNDDYITFGKDHCLKFYYIMISYGYTDNEKPYNERILSLIGE
jgi:hypothetical protein